MKDNIKKWLSAFVLYCLKPFTSQYTPGSIGRLLLSITFFAALCRFWLIKLDPPATMMTVLITLFAYIFGSKVLEWKKTASGTSIAVTPPDQKQINTAPAISKVVDPTKEPANPIDTGAGADNAVEDPST